MDDFRRFLPTQAVGSFLDRAAKAVAELVHAPPASVKPVLKRVFVAEYPSKDFERISSFLKSQRGRGYALVINLATGPSCLSQQGVSCVDAPCASHVDVGTLLETCSMAANCLAEHPENVVLVHSLHSISKPAAFAIAFLMWTSFCSSIDEALIFTCQKLGAPTAILAPSQIRHLEYFYQGHRLRLYKFGALRPGDLTLFVQDAPEVRLNSLTVYNPPDISRGSLLSRKKEASHGVLHLRPFLAFIEIWKDEKCLYSTESFLREALLKSLAGSAQPTKSTLFASDNKIVFYMDEKLSGTFLLRVRVFTRPSCPSQMQTLRGVIAFEAELNTFFLTQHEVPLVLTKGELDGLDGRYAVQFRVALDYMTEFASPRPSPHLPAPPASFVKMSSGLEPFTVRPLTPPVTDLQLDMSLLGSVTGTVNSLMSRGRKFVDAASDRRGYTPLSAEVRGSGTPAVDTSAFDQEVESEEDIVADYMREKHRQTPLQPAVEVEPPVPTEPAERAPRQKKSFATVFKAHLTQAAALEERLMHEINDDFLDGLL
ncbi:MAG: uncharacterized protein KVP18_004437 [Porospora cf. gigantea A]|uniref:uncharacterized protein n=2 Tax=Porospora cf. gigantea A TaxID=2853593 RepID=UPI003559C8EC|nr:MAG: hypothetical protein KVP18_004437 [Porospora cf. gigantea A]